MTSDFVKRGRNESLQGNGLVPLSGKSRSLIPQAPRPYTRVRNYFYCPACTACGTFSQMIAPKKTITAVFYRLSSGKEPVRDWLLSLTQEDRQTIGQDIMTVEFGWPCGEPLCKSLSGYPGLWEVRSNIKSGIARVFFYIDKSEMILLHGLVKKTQKTPDKDLKLAQKRKTEYQKNG